MGIKCPKCQFENPDDTIYCGKCATPLPSSGEVSVTKTLEIPVEGLKRGTTFAERYEIIEELGKGGMGKVYRVEDKKTKEELALKLIKPEISADRKTIERFSNELKLAHKISHRNVCRMYHLGEEKGTHFITMEYVPGEDLKSFIRRSGQLAVGTTIRIAKQVCDGLEEAHRLGVIHRDLKPSNIMIDKEGDARIMDFGIARSLEAKGITGAGVMIGTPEYMSPEQAEVKEVDQRSDIYSLGVILYEMVTGRVPFEGETPLSIAMKHKSEIPRAPKEINDQIPEDLNRVILKCMEKERESRYQSAGELHSELMNLEKGIPTTERIVPERKPLTSREITVTFGLKKLFIPALVVVALVIIVVLIWQPWSQKETVPIPSDKPSLAVVYFENNTGDEDLDHWRKGISDLLITDLTQSKYLKVLSGDKLFNILTQLNQLDAKSYTSDVLAEVASRGRVNHILRGSYSKAGDIIRIDAMLQDAGTGEPIVTERVEGTGEESIFSLVDELTRRVKTSFEFSEEKIADDLDRQVGEITTSSPEAYKYYIEGNKYHLIGEYRKSIALMEKTVEIDPEFAMAYQILSNNYLNLGLLSEFTKYIKKALEFADRLSDRERFQITGDFYLDSEITYDKAIEAYNRLIERYPEDLQGNQNLGFLYYCLEEWDKAIERFEVPVKNKDESIFSFVPLAECYRAKGLYEKSKEILEYYIDNFSDNIVVHQELSRTYMTQGKLDLAMAYTDKAFILEPDDYLNLMLKGEVHLIQGDLVKAEGEFKKMLNAREPVGMGLGMWRLAMLYQLQGKFKEAEKIYHQGIAISKWMGEKKWEAWNHRRMAENYMAAGKPMEALKECEKTRNIAEETEHLPSLRASLHLKGLALLELKSVDEARRMGNELKKMIKEGIHKKCMRYYYHLMGMLELEGESISRAINYFERALYLLPSQCKTIDIKGDIEDHALFIDALASAYYKAGDIERAQEEYEKITQLTTGRLDYGDIYAKSFYMLGKIYEQQGDKTKAIEHYQKFLSLWKDADPGIAEIEDARKRLARLK